jgi:hypothetical protein
MSIVAQDAVAAIARQAPHGTANARRAGDLEVAGPSSRRVSATI